MTRGGKSRGQKEEVLPYAYCTHALSQMISWHKNRQLANPGDWNKILKDFYFVNLDFTPLK